MANMIPTKIIIKSDDKEGYERLKKDLDTMVNGDPERYIGPIIDNYLSDHETLESKAVEFTDDSIVITYESYNHPRVKIWKKIFDDYLKDGSFIYYAWDCTWSMITNDERCRDKIFRSDDDTSVSKLDDMSLYFTEKEVISQVKKICGVKCRSLDECRSALQEDDGDYLWYDPCDFCIVEWADTKGVGTESMMETIMDAINQESDFDKGFEAYENDDYETAITYLSKAKEKKDIAQLILGIIYQKKEDYKKAVSYYKKSSEAGNDDAMYRLGNRYYYGEGVKKDYKKALYWHNKAAELGNKYAQNSLGDYYFYEDCDCEQDFDLAQKWYTAAAEQGLGDAQIKLAEMYIHDTDSIEYNLNKAVEWLEKAADEDDAKEILLKMYYYYKTADERADELLEPEEDEELENKVELLKAYLDKYYNAEDFEVCCVELQLYTGEDEVVVIPYGVEAVIDGAFDDCDFIKEVIIPDTEIEIEDDAFDGISDEAKEKIEEIKFENDFDFDAFESENFVLLRFSHEETLVWPKIYVPKSIKKINDYVFAANDDLEFIKLPAALEDLGEGVFAGCRRLKKVVIQGTLTELKENTFSGCTFLKDINIPDSVTSIKAGCFTGCVHLSEEAKALIRAHGYKDDFDELVKVESTDDFEINEDNFLECYNGDKKNIILPEGIDGISGECFDGVRAESLTIPSSIKCILNGDFYGSNIRKIILPDSVVAIGEYCFNDDETLEEINIPDSVRFFGENCFKGCINLSEESKKNIREHGYTGPFSWSKDDDEDKDYNPVNEMIFVEGGTMILGSDYGEYNPKHEVTLDSFYISKYQVTQKQYEDVTGENPSRFTDPANPVERVSWYDAVEFCNALSKKEGLTPCYRIDKENKDPNNTSEFDEVKWTVECDFTANGYRLPTEAEWEYASRGGQKSEGYEYAGSDDIDEVAWFEDNSDDVTHRVGKKKPNELGIYDFSGNVWEWHWDWYSKEIEGGKNPTGPVGGSGRVQRGGGYFGSGNDCCVFCRSECDDDADDRHDYIGFRLVHSSSK